MTNRGIRSRARKSFLRTAHVEEKSIMRARARNPTSRNSSTHPRDCPRDNSMKSFGPGSLVPPNLDMIRPSANALTRFACWWRRGRGAGMDPVTWWINRRLFPVRSARYIGIKNLAVEDDAVGAYQRSRDVIVASSML